MSNAAEMPRYRCHKTVHALKISATIENDSGVEIHFVEKSYAPVLLISGHERFKFEDKYGDQDFGYYVVYKDGYRSWSPTDAFEEGYTRL